MSVISKLAVIVSPDTTIKSTVGYMAELSGAVAYPGIAVVLDDQGVVHGVLTDGDIRRAYANGTNFNLSVQTEMISDPIAISNNLPLEEVVPEVFMQVRKVRRLSVASVRHILVLDDARKLTDIYDFVELLTATDHRFNAVAVFGMGYVGLTLATALASRGHAVTGVDINPGLVDRLSEGNIDIIEPGLEGLVLTNLRRDRLSFVTDLEGHRHRVYIVAVGTPVAADGIPDLTALKSTCETISGYLTRGDIVMLRSTIPVGITRDVVIPLMEELSGLRAGTDFHVAFTPERTAEGRAMQELRQLPQIVGGLTSKCTDRAASFWATLTQSVIRVESLEAAEMVKLANNTFRDLSFAFANELALLSDRFNIDAFELIQSANEGYPRNPIPQPSPGVGGYCLTKDPLLFDYVFSRQISRPSLGKAGRITNEDAKLYPVEITKRFAKIHDLKPEELNVLVIGIAFKGDPETSDLRGSVAVDIGNHLTEMGARLTAWDAVVDPHAMRELGFCPVEDLPQAVTQANVILILNNHRKNVSIGALLAKAPDTPKLVFDGWNLLDRFAIESIDGLSYSTMGYLSTYESN
jgi:UDP-N-acetyl-D-mannosaminuronic acid dehydrogenase